ncbi:MAG: aconitate hydratase AcnA [Candidatus Bathyarchaeia archaeon]
MKLKIDVKTELQTSKGEATVFSLNRFEESGLARVSEFPCTIKVLLENLLRHSDGKFVTEANVSALAKWGSKSVGELEIPYMPSRVILQDFTGVPVILDLAAMRSAIANFGGESSKINPTIPTELVIDHSVQVDYFGAPSALALNIEKEYNRNNERYTFLRWARQAFNNLKVIPPGKGIVHQVNIEYLANVVHLREANGETTVFPDTLVGTDSHTTMVNGLGVLGWGVGGIEAEAVMLGQPYYMTVPEVVGVRLKGELPEGATATDLVLTVTNILRKYGVVGKFVEFFGPGLRNLTVPDRATIANMAPEYGATVGYFPIDEGTLQYLQGTARSEEQVQLVESYAKAQGLFYDDAKEPSYSDVIEVDVRSIEPSIAGPKNPEDKVPLKNGKTAFLENLDTYLKEKDLLHNGSESDWHYEGGQERSNSTASFGQVMRTKPTVRIPTNGQEYDFPHGTIAIAAITSCTNTSNPTVMIGAGLVAKKAVDAGIQPKPYVKTSLAPGSRVVTDYLRETGLLQYLERLGFNLVGYGCTTCIGNSGPLLEPITSAIKDYNLYIAAVLSGNRNFEARIHPLVRANYLASPMLVVAYSLAGRMDIDITSEPLAFTRHGKPVYLKDIWPSQNEIQEIMRKTLKPSLYRLRYMDVLRGDQTWETLPVPKSSVYSWDDNSTYIKEPPFCNNLPKTPPPLQDLSSVYVLAILGDRVTTDHISPAGNIQTDTPAGKSLIALGIKPEEFNTYGARRGNHEIMMRGTFANMRLKNLMITGVEGGWTIHVPSGKKMTIYDAAMEYKKQNTPLIVIAGKQYGAGSSRDWAAKGTSLLGVKAVIAESYERIHRSNLLGMGVLPLQFLQGQNAKTLGLTGLELYDVQGITGNQANSEGVTVAAKVDGKVTQFDAKVRLDTPIEWEYYRHGGILPYVLRNLAK